ncbi:MAG: DEAD/DEAH box helicase [Planctomycetota bacterium]
MATFASFGLSSHLLKTLTAEGYDTPTPIQAECIRPALAGQDLLGCAQTGTGKTAAFSLPLIERLLPRKLGGQASPRRVRALVLAPTRELAAQIDASLRTYGRGTGLRAAIIYGGVKQGRQVRQLQAGVDVIVATPGRLLDLLEQGHVDLRGIEMLVLDEADRMLDMGFIDPIKRIAKKLPVKRQTLLFSATMPPKIRVLAETMLTNPVSVSVDRVASAAPKIEQSLYHIAGPDKTRLLTHLLEARRIERSVVFTKTKRGADKLAEMLVRDGVTASAIHGNRSQSQRERALAAFRKGKFRVLVATDVAARGLDVDGISCVFNYNLPMEAEAYVHRIGRTGRAGEAGCAISFCSREERGLLRDIEQLMGSKIGASQIPAAIGVTGETVRTSVDRSASGSGSRRRAKGGASKSSAAVEDPRAGARSIKPSGRSGRSGPHKQRRTRRRDDTGSRQRSR